MCMPCFTLSKRFKKDPVSIAKLIAEAVRDHLPMVKVESMVKVRRATLTDWVSGGVDGYL